MENNVDKWVDDTLEKCILTEPRKSFFLFAGAGSGKTHSLVMLLEKIADRMGCDLLLQGKKVAVITYTNAATNEINNRLNYNSVFHISTIHSFVWDVIRWYQSDIKRLYCRNLNEEIEEISNKLCGIKNKSTKTYLANYEKLTQLNDRLVKAKSIEKFVYNPNGSNPEFNALKHAYVIKISAQMILESSMMQRLIAQKYPILLIDESQDTKKELVDAFLTIQKNFHSVFALGLLGDQKQRIYTDGKVGIDNIIPRGWEKPVKQMNYRCAKRIVSLANTIGKEIDQHAEQRARDDADQGFVRLFVIKQHENLNKDEVERIVMKRMQKCTGDVHWNGSDAGVKILTLEHMMAARRMGFDRFFGSLSSVGRYQMTFLQGMVTEVDFFTKEVLPITQSLRNDGSEALRILKAYSPLLARHVTENPYDRYLQSREAARKLAELVNDNHAIREVIKCVSDSGLLTIPDVLSQASKMSNSDIYDDMDEDLRGWVEVMDLPIDEVRRYDDYVNNRSRFDTHQGVKGLEFDRVMVIIDDSEARGFMFSYDKLFGVKALSDTDMKHMAAGEETSVERTQRLFYVTCTRAKHSLAVVMYTTAPEAVKAEVKRKGWFEDSEIEEI